MKISLMQLVTSLLVKMLKIVINYDTFMINTDVDTVSGYENISAIESFNFNHSAFIQIYVHFKH